MTTDKVEHILSRIRTLPTLPIIVYKLLKLIESETSTATELSEVISKDQAMTARILRLVNSSFYALRAQVVKVSHAIALLGFVAIKNLSLGLSVIDMFGRGDAGGELDGDAFWEHSLCCATCARLIAERIRYVPAEEAFIAGLLHDIGKLVLHDHFRREQDTALRAAREDMIPLPQAERFFFKTDHAEVGDALAKHWRLPRQLRIAIGGHHHYSKDDKLTNIVSLANTLSKIKQIGSGGNVLLEPMDDRLWAAVGIDEPSVIRLLGKLAPEIHNAKIFLGLSTPPKGGRFDQLDRDEAPTKRVLIVEEEESAMSPVELVLLDSGHTTARTTDPYNEAADMADLVLLDYSAQSLGAGRAVRAQIEARLDRRVPVALLPAPRRVSDIIETVEAAVSEARV